MGGAQLEHVKMANRDGGGHRRVCPQVLKNHPSITGTGIHFVILLDSERDFVDEVLALTSVRSAFSVRCRAGFAVSAPANITAKKFPNGVMR